MGDYTTSAVRAARETQCETVVLCGWSMGGLVALAAAGSARPAAVVVLEPSPPAEIAGFHDDIVEESGTFSPNDDYGAWPDNPSTRPESRLARSERRRGVSVAQIDCPLLVVTSQTYAATRGTRIADFYGGDLMHFANLNHVSLVTDPSVPLAVSDWLDRIVSAPGKPGRTAT